jgi:hypothetical protein
MNARSDIPPDVLASLEQAASGVEPSPMFTPFSWTTPEADKASTLNQLSDIKDARDIAAGVAALLGMLEREELDAGCEDDEGRLIPKLFCSVVRGNLQRLTITSLQMLADRMDAAIDRANSSAEERAGG